MEQRALRMVEHGGEGLELRLHQESRGFYRQLHAHHGRVRAVRGAEGVVHINITEPGKAGAKFLDGLRVGLLRGAVFQLYLAFLLDVEAKVFKQEHVAGFERSRGVLGHGADTVLGKGHGLPEQLAQFSGHGLERKFRDTLAVRPAEMRHEHDARALLEGKLDRGQGRDNALVVGDGAGGLVLRDVEIDAHEHALAGQIEIADGFEFRHWKSEKNNRGLRRWARMFERIIRDHPRHPRLV